MKLKNFFAELQRRNVYKVAVAYAVVGWLLIQVATQVSPFFEIPDWAVRVVVLVIAAGFPVALVIAWAFEMTPEGLKRTEDVAPNESIPHWSRRKFAVMIAGIALVAGALLVLRIWRTQSGPTTAPPPARSIAVLPFDNLSRDPDNAYFTEGVQEEIVDRANAEMKQALELDPLSLVINDDVGDVFLLTGHAVEAVAQLRKAIAMDPRAYYVHRDLGQALEAAGDLSGAIAEYRKATQLDDDPSSFAFLGAAEARNGDRAAALDVLQKVAATAKRRYVPDYLFAVLYLALGEKDEALRWLDSSYAKHQPDLNAIRIDPNLRALHGDSRFQALAEKIVPAREFSFPKTVARR